MSIKLIMDSSSDLSKELIEKYNVRVVPLHTFFGEKDYKAGVDLDNEMFYDLLEKSEHNPRTAAITPSEFEDVFREELEKNDEIICITIGSKASGTCQSAIIAKNIIESDKIHIVDSNALCMGEGVLGIVAAKMIEDGKTVAQIIPVLEELTENKIEHLVSIDTLEYLVRGGRIKASKAFLAQVLNIKPILNVEDAITVPIGKVRGRKKIIPYLIKHMEKNLDFEKNEFMVICHSACPERANEFAQKFKEKFDWNKPIYICELGATIGTHTGKGVIATFYIKK